MNLKGKRITKLLVLSMIFVVLVANVLGVSAANAVELWLSTPIDNTDEFCDPLPNAVFEDDTLRDRGAGWALLGDADFTGFVELDDFYVYIENYGKREGEWDPSIDPDLDDNGIVDEADHDVWYNNIGAEIIYTLDARAPFGWSWHFSEGNGKGNTPFWLKNWVSKEAVNAIRHYARANDPFPIDVAFSFLFFPEVLSGAYVIAEVEVFEEGGGSDVFSGEPFYFNEAELNWTEVSVTVPISMEVVGIKVKIGGYGGGSFRAWIDEAKFIIVEHEVNSHYYGNLACSVNVLSYQIKTQDTFKGQVTLGIAVAADSPPWNEPPGQDWILRNIMVKVELLPNDGTNTTQPGQLYIRWFEHGNDKGFELSPSQIDQANRKGSPAAKLALSFIGTAIGFLIPGAGAYAVAKFVFSALWATGTTLAFVHGENLATTYEHFRATGGSDYAVWENCDYAPYSWWSIKTAYSYAEVEWSFDTDSLDPEYAVRVTAQAAWIDDEYPANYYVEETTTEVRVTRNTPIRDVSVTNVIASPTSVLVGEPVTINATVKNEGDNIENVEVNTYYDDSNFIGKQTVKNLAPDSSTTLTYTWATYGVPLGAHTIKAVASIVPVVGETDPNNNVRYFDGTVTVGCHDVAITGVAPSPVTVMTGEPVTINVDVKNEGYYTETDINVTTYYNSTAIDTQTINNLLAGDSTTLTFTWDTAGVSSGTYRIKAVADVVPGETDTADNTYIDGLVGVHIVRNIDTGLGYATIQGAINAPQTLPGHTIQVAAGTYYEHVIVNKSLTLIGEDPSTTIIDGNGAGNIFTVQANNVHISRFTVQNGQYGIYLDQCNNTSVSDNVVSSNFNSIYVYNSGGNTISNNTVTNNENGISLWGTESYGNDVSCNTAENNIWFGLKLATCSGNFVSNNTLSSNDFYGMYIQNSCENNIVVNNMISSNGLYGIFLENSSNNNTLTENTVSYTLSYDQSAGIKIFSSNNNTIYHNHFTENTKQVTTFISENKWDNGYPSGGNYWSDYNGTDQFSGPDQDEAGSDFIGDTPYVIDGNNRDNYPLIANRPPNTPSAPSYSHRYYNSYSYSTNTTDNDGDNVRYEFDWGDNSTTTTGWYASGNTATASHSWNSPGTYNVKVRAQDVYYHYSEWSPYLTVNIITFEVSSSPKAIENTGIYIDGDWIGTSDGEPFTTTPGYHDIKCTEVIYVWKRLGPRVYKVWKYEFDYWTISGQGTTKFYSNPINWNIEDGTHLTAYYIVTDIFYTGRGTH